MSDNGNRGIISEILNYENGSDQTIFSYSNHPKESSPFFIVIPPALGETKRDSLKQFYYLAKGCFNVLRYVASFHLGEITSG